MQCPECKSTHIRKNGIKKGKQNHICVDCCRQFIEQYESSKGYSDEMKRDCLKMYVNGMGFRGIERVKGVHHTTVIAWVTAVGKILAYALSQFNLRAITRSRNAYAPKYHTIFRPNALLYIYRLSIS